MKDDIYLYVYVYIMCIFYVNELFLNEKNNSVPFLSHSRFVYNQRPNNLRVNCIKQERYKTRPLYFLKRKNDPFSNA